MSLFAELRTGADAADLGGKARSLVRLAELQLRTPNGFVVTSAVFAALCPDVPVFTRIDDGTLTVLDQLRQQILRAPWPAGFLDELGARLARLGAASVAVRSSFAGEDAAGHLAAGVYESYRDVPASGVEQAIRKVLASALAPGAVAYALAHGKRPAEAPLSVLIHEFLLGDAEGTAAFAPSRMQEPVTMVRRGSLDEARRSDLAGRLVALASEWGATEVEWVESGGRLVYLQARPYESPLPPKRWSGFDDLSPDEPDPSHWRWDASHNPLPLSAAQAGLVAFADELCHIGIRQRVLGGYLFYTHAGAWAPPALASELAEEFFSSLASAVDVRLAHLRQAPTLEEALAVFRFAYEPIFGMLQPALRRTHEKLRAFLEQHDASALSKLPLLRSGVPSMASQRAELARLMATPEGRDEARERYLAAFGDETPIWDVAARTYAEAPEQIAVGCVAEAPPALDWQAASAEVEAVLAPALREIWRKLLNQARAAVALGEADDWLYARTQAAVRHALVGLGRRLVESNRLAAVDDVFDLPLSVARELAAGKLAAIDLKAVAASGRAAWLAAKGNPPPSPSASDAPMIRGVGTGGRAIGHVRCHRPGEPADSSAVLVAATLLPTELPLIRALAIVTETGGPLDHVAAQARERRIPAVVGAAGACANLHDGELVLVDADAGLVVHLRG